VPGRENSQKKTKITLKTGTFAIFSENSDRHMENGILDVIPFAKGITNFDPKNSRIEGFLQARCFQSFRERPADSVKEAGERIF
jgi:hypothetical protein